MSASSFRFGYSVGTAVREIFRATRTTGRPTLPIKANTVRAFPTQSSASSAAELEEMCHTPALVRRVGNLTDWYNENVREVKPPLKSRKPRPRKSAAVPAVANACSHFLDGIDVSKLSEDAWDLLSR